MTFLLGQIVAGILVGAFYALVALGYTMVYGVLRLINFAHGDFYMVGSFIGFTLLGGTGFALGHGPLADAATLVIAMLAVGALATVVERIAYRPLRRAPILAMMITALGVSLILENGVLAIPAWGSQYQVYPASLPGHGLRVLGISVTVGQLLILLIAVALMVGLYFFVQKTIVGKAMRAIALDRDAAWLMGIDVNRIIALTFFIGGALAGAAGVLGGMFYGQINYLMGFSLGLKAFTAAVLGGIGNIPGAMVGGFTLGVLESIGAGYLGSQWANVFSFGVLILLLVFRPTGILGERIAQRV